MTGGDFQPTDHPWHHGLQYAIPRVDGHNLWGGGTFVGLAEGYRIMDDQGDIVHDTWLDKAVEDSTTTHLAHDLRWRGHNGELPLTERRSLRFTTLGTDPHPDGWALDLRSILTNPSKQRRTLGHPQSGAAQTVATAGSSCASPRG